MKRTISLLIFAVIATATMKAQNAVPVGTAGNASPAVVSTQGVAGGVPVPVGPALGTYTDRSGSITLGGTAQTLAAINLTRKQVVIENPCTATGQGIAAAENLYINFTTAAGVNTGASIELLPCGSFTFPALAVSTELISVNAATTSHKWIAKEM